MKQIRFKAAPLFKSLKSCKTKVIVNQGGTRSSKTWSELLLLILRCIEKPNYEVVVIGKDVPFLKMGPMSDTRKIFNLYPDLYQYVDSFNISDRKYTFTNGSYIIFSSFENEDDIKMSDVDDVFMNEANTIKFGYKIFKQAKNRTRHQVILDYNPTAPFWVHDKIIGSSFATLFITDHRHNPFLPSWRHKLIEEDIEDLEYWKVYARGMTGNIKGIVYPKRQVITEIPDDLEEVIWGIDYGYTNGKTAVLRTHIDRKNKTLYEKGCCYQPGLEADQILQIMLANGYEPGQPFYSEHDPVKIGQLRRLGCVVFKAKKGALSEYNAVSKLRQWRACFLFDENLNREYARCQFEVAEGSSTSDGTASEIVTNKIKDTNNYHYMAAKRYSEYTHLFSVHASTDEEDDE